MKDKRKVKVLYSLHCFPFPEEFVKSLYGLAELIFGKVDRDDFAWRLENLPDVSVHIAQCDELFAGFKFGHAISSKRYISWLGGVHPDFQRLGIAGELMRRQHKRLSQKGYLGVETTAANNNHAMIQLNVKSGFDVIGSYSRSDMPRTILYKSLNK